LNLGTSSAACAAAGATAMIAGRKNERIISRGRCAY
jgi:hypothetical protein